VFLEKLVLRRTALVLFFTLCASGCSRSGQGSTDPQYVVYEISSRLDDVSLFSTGAEWDNVKESLEGKHGYFEMGSKFVCLVYLQGGALQTEYKFEAEFEDWVARNSVLEVVQWMNGSQMLSDPSNFDFESGENDVTPIEEIVERMQILHSIRTVVHPKFLEVRPRKSEDA